MTAAHLGSSLAISTLIKHGGIPAGVITTSEYEKCGKFFEHLIKHGRPRSGEWACKCRAVGKPLALAPSSFATSFTPDANPGGAVNVGWQSPKV